VVRLSAVKPFLYIQEAWTYSSFRNALLNPNNNIEHNATQHSNKEM
jgi:hypothetical protein